MATIQSAILLQTSPLGLPEQLEWHGHIYRVTDTPTVLDRDWGLMTHPPKGLLIGWRFHGTDQDGDSRVFDVLFNDVRQEWELLRDYV
jgi:hypothetical protein